jgi:hypothetical protein
MAGLPSWLDSGQPSAQPPDHDTLIARSRAIVRMVDGLRAAGTPLSKKAELDYALAQAVLEREQQRRSAALAGAPELPSGRDQQSFAQAVRLCRAIVRVVERLRQDGEDVNEQARAEYELACGFMEMYHIPRD